MSHGMSRIWREENGVLTFEWILLITVLVIGIVGGLSAVRDATIDELGDVSDAMVHVDQSYWINPPLQASIYDQLTFPVENYISGSANASYASGVWHYTASAYQDVAGTVTRWRPTNVAGQTDTGIRPTQNAKSVSSAPGEQGILMRP